MNEPDISPLAKRLAEENNVRWQELKGSGAGGKVVERDVLEYLARVMAGDEAVDPTPEPVPEGMEAWPQEDLSAYRRDLGGDLGDLQAELSAADRVESPTIGDRDGDLEIGDITVTSDQDDDSLDDTELISEDIFLFEESEPGFEAVGNGVADDDLLIAGDESVGAVAEDGFELAAEESDADAERDDFDMFAAVEDGDDSAAAVGNDDIAADGSGGGEAIPDLFAAGDADLEHDDVELFAEADDDIVVQQAEAAPEMIGAAEDVLEMTSSGVEDVTAEDLLEATGADGEDVADVLTTDEADKVAYDVGADLAADASTLEVPDDGLDLDVSDESASARDDAVPVAITADSDIASDLDGDLESDVGSDLDGVLASDLDGDLESDVGSDLDGVLASDLDGDLGSDVGSDLDGVLASDLGIAAAAASGEAVSLRDTSEAMLPPVATEVGAELPLVSYGALLRRHIDLTALAAAQLAVGREVDQGDPIAPTSFVVRAAAKAQRRVSLGEGSIGVASFEDGFGVFALDDAATVPFTELLQRMADAVGSGAVVDGMAVVVADMSALEVDEAVLHLGVPVLTLGRILYDNQQGSYRSTLSLSGDVAPDRGARFLAQVADLLDAPVQLVL